MKVEVKTYDLPDFNIFRSEKLVDHVIWRPDRKYLVLGRSNNAENSLYLDSVTKDGIEIFKRPSGGETVMISQNTLVISVKIRIDNIFETHKYFRIINARIIEGLSKTGIKNLSIRGISDICIGNKKILGSSIFRDKNIIFYHAVLNISESPEIISKYLKHPSREPDYREGRDHSKFITSLFNEGYKLEYYQISDSINQELEKL